MNITYLDGSPKAKGSNSLYLLKALAEKMTDGTTPYWADARKYDLLLMAQKIKESDALVIAFPLYVDGIPSHLLQLLEELQPLLKVNQQVHLYTIVNCGFYEARQNHIALSMMKLWCQKSGLTWGLGIGIGAGGMVQVGPLGRGPATNLGKAFDLLTNFIDKKQSSEDIFVEPNFPRFLYKAAAQMGFRSDAKKNTLKPASLYDYHPQLLTKDENSNLTPN